MPKLESFDGCSLFYDDQGDGRAVLLLHGFVGDINIDWIRSGILDLLLDEGHRVVAYDARGHGLSDKPHAASAYEDDALTKDAKAVLDHLGIDDVVCVGFSMGARTALHLAAIDPRVRGVVALGVGAPQSVDPEIAASFTSVPDAMLTDDPDSIEGDFVRSFRDMADAIHADRVALAALMAAQRTEVPSIVDDVKVPVLVIAGVDDPAAADPGTLAVSFADGRALQTAGDHAGVKDQPDAHAAIVEFVASL
jgi:pimeloyl-ACP methyl ester carboxylesterase